MDKSFKQMSALLQAIWPEISNIDWSQYCTQGVSAYDDAGVPKYTGLLMHRAGGGCIGASTVAVGFLPRPEKSAVTVTNKTNLVTNRMRGAKTSIEKRDPADNIWGGGVLCSQDENIAYGITGLPEIGDHLLVSEMMWACNILCLDDWNVISDPHSDAIHSARHHVGMSITDYNNLKNRIGTIVEIAVKEIF